jgi:hypothetical protein
MMLEVGKPYVPGRASLRARTEYSFRSGEHALLLCFYDLDDSTLDDVRAGEGEFALLVHRDVIFFLYRFGQAIPWNATPYSWHRLSEAQRRPPPEPENGEHRALLQIILVDADRNLVRALRTVAFSPGFTAALHREIRAQAESPWNPLLYDLKITEACQTWPDPRAMVEVAIVRCRVEEGTV